MLTTIVAVVIVLGGLIFFHELGHFVVARLLGMGVSTFSLGFGPKILTFKGKKTEYALSLIPLGGYVALVGESDSSELPEGFTSQESFADRPPWQRLLVVAAGPLANIILAWLICWALAFCYGVPTLQAVIGQVSTDSPAERAHLAPGDAILAINGKPVDSWDAMTAMIGESNGDPLLFSVERPTQDAGSGRIFEVEIRPERSVRKTIFGGEESAWLIGVRAGSRVLSTPLPFFQAAVAGLGQTWRMASLTWQSFVKLAQRVVPIDQVGGPIMIAQMVGQQAHEGLSGLLALTALISINLGILNLLPVPVLDGGQIVFCLYEMISGRELPLRVREYAMRVGVVLLVALMALATFNDIARFFK